MSSGTRRTRVRCIAGVTQVLVAGGLGLLGPATSSAAQVAPKAGRASGHHAARAASRRSLAGAVFGGVTSSGAPVVLQVSRSGREIVKAAIAVNDKCQPSGVEFLTPDLYTRVPVSSKLAFHETAEWQEALSSAPVTGATWTSQISGHFNRSMTSISGTWSLSVVYNGAAGETVDRCESGPVSFTAIQ